MADLGSLLGSAGIGGAIGKAIVSLELSTAKYQAELKTAQAQTVAGTNTMGSSFSKFSGLAANAFAVIGVAAVAGLAASVKAANDANVAHIALQNTFKNNANLADSSVAEFEALADSLQRLTGVDDEAVIAGEALLGTMGLTGDAIKELTPLVVDLSSKYDIDLQAAFKAVGRATQGSTGALSRYIGAVEAGKTPTESFANVVEKLGTVQGFAAEKAKAEPWLLLQGAMDRIAETIGAELLPVIQDLAQTIQDNIGVVEKLGQSIVTLIDIYKDLAQISYAPWTVPGDAMRELGGEVDTVVAKSPELQKFLEDTGEGFKDVGTAAKGARQDVVKFANMTGKELEEWSEGVKKSIDEYIFDLDNLSTQTEITRKEFIQGHKAMLARARETATALREIAREDWVNPKYIAFLSAEGPDALTRFASLNEDKQKKMQDLWQKTADKTDTAKNAVDKMTEALGHLDGGSSRHKVIIEYDYVGFDPSKPGMSQQK